MNKTEVSREVIARINNVNSMPGKDLAELPISLGREFVDTMLDVVSEELKKNGKVVISGFGTFFIRNQKARAGVNPRTGAPLRIPARRVPTFKPGKTLKESIR